MDRLAHVKKFVRTAGFKQRVAVTQEADRVKRNACASERHQVRKTDPDFAWRGKVRMVVKGALAARGCRKLAQRTTELLGCTGEELKRHLTSLFTAGMTWDKVLSGEIHIDHRRPVVMFDLTDARQRRECCHYTNLQPLWAVDNLSKNSNFGGIKFTAKLRESEGFDLLLLLVL